MGSVICPKCYRKKERVEMEGKRDPSAIHRSCDEFPASWWQRFRRAIAPIRQIWTCPLCGYSKSVVPHPLDVPLDVPDDYPPPPPLPRPAGYKREGEKS